MSEQTHAMEKVNTSMWNVEDAARYAENMRVIDEWDLRRADERKSQERFQERLRDFLDTCPTSRIRKIKTEVGLGHSQCTDFYCYVVDPPIRKPDSLSYGTGPWSTVRETKEQQEECNSHQQLRTELINYNEWQIWKTQRNIGIFTFLVWTFIGFVSAGGNPVAGALFWYPLFAFVVLLPVVIVLEVLASWWEAINLNSQSKLGKLFSMIYVLWVTGFFVFGFFIYGVYEMIAWEFAN